jgi:hypothetical protein
MIIAKGVGTGVHRPCKSGSRRMLDERCALGAMSDRCQMWGRVDGCADWLK